MSSSPNRRVLVVDDNRAIHEDFRKILCPPRANFAAMAPLEDAIFGRPISTEPQRHFELEFACQGEEALECVKQACLAGRPYALAFIDIRMPPGWDGVETIAHLWPVDPELQIVICSAYSDYTWSEMTAKLGQSDRLIILRKPFDNIEVAQIAETLAHKWQLQLNSRHRLQELELLATKRNADLTSAVSALRSEIEERKRAETQRQIMEIQLRQALKLEAIGQLAAGIAHEINTPAQYVGDNVRFLQESHRQIATVLDSHRAILRAFRASALDDRIIADAEKTLLDADIDYVSQQVPAAIQETLEGVDRITKIVRAMKDFSHPGSSEKTLADINKAIETTVTVARNEWKYVADLKLDLDPGLPLICCFLGEFNQTILNLVINAAHAIGDVLKMTPLAKGTITVRTRRDADSVCISVQDTGTGIPEQYRPRIFEPFFTTKEVGKGSGQGLTIAYACIVKQHGGSIRFDTQTGRGTTFFLTLPISAPSNGSDRRQL